MGSKAKSPGSSKRAFALQSEERVRQRGATSPRGTRLWPREDWARRVLSMPVSKWSNTGSVRVHGYAEWSLCSAHSRALAAGHLFGVGPGGGGGGVDGQAGHLFGLGTKLLLDSSFSFLHAPPHLSCPPYLDTNLEQPPPPCCSSTSDSQLRCLLLAATLNPKP